MFVVLIGAALVICGTFLLFREALGRRPLSDPHRTSSTDTKRTLEPSGQGLRFLGVTRNWLGLGLAAAGGALLILAAYM
ncbi:hypothetical protein HGP14_08605 [Rhizobium sp. P32RR-XVIII]|uniref:hypothetical protein n=1 Tax=Rhizobium sp. P32RR-XVIII TaxID=2726738 RepID=UPI001456666C|nr:hypothetical protein [Rhizobium sp. P32RR-XVIII]NLS03429.1 hypothetical protein [Rhizobium sp. P32RR-XVIII]